MKVTVYLMCVCLLAGCSVRSPEQDTQPQADPVQTRTNITLQVGVTTMFDVKKSRGEPEKYEGEHAEAGTITWVYADVKLHFKQGRLERIEEEPHNN